jgi:hypothetical protein
MLSAILSSFDIPRIFPSNVGKASFDDRQKEVQPLQRTMGSIRPYHCLRRVLFLWPPVSTRIHKSLSPPPIREMSVEFPARKHTVIFPATPVTLPLTRQENEQRESLYSVHFVYLILYLFIQFVGHASQRGLTATNFGCCHASPRRLTNTIFVTVCPKNGSKPYRIRKNHLVGSEAGN